MSEAMWLRDGILERLKGFLFFQGFYFTSNKSLQIQPQNIPFCGVYLIEETSVPDGESNVAEVRFRSSVRIGFSVIIQNNDAAKAEVILDRAYQAIARGLFGHRSPHVYPNVKVQAFSNGLRQHVFGSVGLDNEMPIAELRYELICDLGAITYEPFVPDMLDVIHLETKVPEGTPKIEASWDIEQT